MGTGPAPRSGRRNYVSEINVTPLVDVMLVLLIIFMVTAPMMTKGLDVKLPETAAKPIPQKKEPVIITVRADGAVILGKAPVDLESLKTTLARMKEKGQAEQVLLRADKEVPYGVVAEVIGATREAGIEDLGLVTEPPEDDVQGKPKQK
ncbi:MAG: protein TolR [Deltaproteobacteria bacterium]